METPRAHTLPPLLPKPSPQNACASPSWFRGSGLTFVYCTTFVGGVWEAHAHHLGRKVSSVRGTLVPWSAGSSPWSGRLWLWSHRISSSDVVNNLTPSPWIKHLTNFLCDWTYKINTGCMTCFLQLTAALPLLDKFVQLCHVLVVHYCQRQTTKPETRWRHCPSWLVACV